MQIGIQGRLEDFAETGTEGVIWTLYEKGKEGYEGLHIIDEGDYLIIYENDGGVIFCGHIKKDTETGKVPRPFNFEFKQQTALGFWVHWIQEGWNPDDWARFFIGAEYRAKLVKKDRDSQL